MKLLFISLGCDKNLVDSEYMIGMLANDGIEMTDDETQADIIIVNSCCFIGDAWPRPTPATSRPCGAATWPAR